VLYLMDASIYVFRGWFALPDTLTSPDGEPANGFRGFATSLTDILTIIADAPLVVCFDESLSHSFRNEIEPSYKANRELPPPELERQFQWCHLLCQALGIPTQVSQRYEADDLMATLARQQHEQGGAVTLISRDKDLLQIMREQDMYWEGPGKPPQDYSSMREKLGFAPQHMADWLALTGDAVDNISGVRGIGAKTASALIGNYETLEGIYDNLDDIPSLGLRGAAGIQRKLEAGKNEAFRARELTRLYERVPLEHDAENKPARAIHRQALRNLQETVGLGQRNWEKLQGYANHG